MKTLISPRVTATDGQKFPLPQPATTPRRASSSIQRQKALDAGTSANISDPAAHAGGWYPGASRA